MRPRLSASFSLARASGDAFPPFPQVAWRLSYLAVDAGLLARWLLALILMGLPVAIRPGCVEGVGRETWRLATEAFGKAQEPVILPPEPVPKFRRRKVTVKIRPEWQRIEKN